MAEAAPLHAEDPRRLGRYRLIGRLGEGGQGAVYLAQGDSGPLVAVKALGAAAIADTVARRRFAGEVALARQVSSFCIAEVLDADLDGDRPYIVSEFVDGPSLQASIVADGPRSGGALRRLAIGTVTALAAIHQAGIVHRDVKPHNVVLGPDGPRVVDFGIARMADATITSTSSVIGSVAYMSPEQVHGGEIGPPSDLFSWAMTIAYAASGEPLFGRDSLPAVVARIIDAEPVLPPMAADLAVILLACLAKDPRQRPTANEVLLRLIGNEATPQLVGNEATPQQRTDHQPHGPASVTAETVAGDTATDAPTVVSTTGQQPPPAPARRGRLLALLAGAGVLVVVIALVLVLRPWADDSRGDSGKAGTGSSAAAPAPTPPDVGALLFHDDFTYHGGWDGYTFNPDAPPDQRSLHGYEITKGVFTVRADRSEPTNGALSPMPEKTQQGDPITDVDVGVTTVLQPGSRGPGDYGLVCRQNENVPNGYGFVLGLDGAVMVSRTTQGARRDLLVTPVMVSAPRTGKAVRLRIRCTVAGVGTHLVFWVGDRKVVDLTDPVAFPVDPVSQVGLAVHSPESGTGVATVSFDDFSVYRPR